MTKALRQGALVDTMNRFPVLAKILIAVMPSRIEKLTQDTRKHENHTIELIERSASSGFLVFGDPFKS